MDKKYCFSFLPFNKPGIDSNLSAFQMVSQFIEHIYILPALKLVDISYILHCSYLIETKKCCGQRSPIIDIERNIGNGSKVAFCFDNKN